MNSNGYRIGLDKVFFFIHVVFIATLGLWSLSVYETVSNQRLRSDKQLIDSVLRVAAEPIAMRDEIRIQRVLEAFHEKGRYFRFLLPNNFEIIWPREFFSPMWKTKPNYQAKVRVGDNQEMVVEYWANQNFGQGSLPLLLLFFSFVLSLGSVSFLFLHLRRWKADVVKIEGYLATESGAVDLGRFNFDFFHNLALQIMEKEREREKRFEIEKSAERHREVATLAAQVAHDIRSPLAALNIATRDLDQLHEDTRILLRGAVTRIQDVANGLLAKNRGFSPICSRNSEPTERAEIQLIPTMIESILSEKRLQFRDKPVEISFSGCTHSGVFAKTQPVEFKRVLSNLVNNAVESFKGNLEEKPGCVSVELCESLKTLQIKVADNGLGIPQEVLARLGNRGESHGKEGGSGLGIHHAIRSVERWDGRVSIRSTVGVGTVVEIELPKTETPDWFVSELRLEPQSVVIILDDDPSIHQIWKKRLAPLEKLGIVVHHFYQASELCEFTRELSQAATTGGHVMNLIDYELIGSGKTGLDVISELGIAKSSVLVTSRADEPHILSECLKLGLRLIPKAYAGFVPITADEARGQSSGLRTRPLSPVEGEVSSIKTV